MAPRNWQFALTCFLEDVYMSEMRRCRRNGLVRISATGLLCFVGMNCRISQLRSIQGPESDYMPDSCGGPLTQTSQLLLLAWNSAVVFIVGSDAEKAWYLPGSGEEPTFVALFRCFGSCSLSFVPRSPRPCNKGVDGVRVTSSETLSSALIVQVLACARGMRGPSERLLEFQVIRPCSNQTFSCSSGRGREMFSAPKANGAIWSHLLASGSSATSWRIPSAPVQVSFPKRCPNTLSCLSDKSHKSHNVLQLLTCQAAVSKAGGPPRLVEAECVRKMGALREECIVTA